MSLHYRKRKGLLELKTFTHVEFPVHEFINILNLYNQKYSQNKDLTSMRLFLTKYLYIIIYTHYLDHFIFLIYFQSVCRKVTFFTQNKQVQFYDDANIFIYLHQHERDVSLEENITDLEGRSVVQWKGLLFRALLVNKRPPIVPNELRNSQ